jgi:hypothetical protein
MPPYVELISSCRLCHLRNWDLGVFRCYHPHYAQAGQLLYAQYMPRADEQLVVVYLGVIFKEAGERQAGTPKDRRSTIISAVVLVVGFGMSPTLDKR